MSACRTEIKLQMDYTCVSFLVNVSLYLNLFLFILIFFLVETLRSAKHVLTQTIVSRSSTVSLEKRSLSIWKVGNLLLTNFIGAQTPLLFSVCSNIELGMSVSRRRICS